MDQEVFQLLEEDLRKGPREDRCRVLLVTKRQRLFVDLHHRLGDDNYAKIPLSLVLEVPTVSIELAEERAVRGRSRG